MKKTYNSGRQIRVRSPRLSLAPNRSSPSAICGMFETGVERFTSRD
jgi:hypothetical protein